MCQEVGKNPNYSSSSPKALSPHPAVSIKHNFRCSCQAHYLPTEKMAKNFRTQYGPCVHVSFHFYHLQNTPSYHLIWKDQLYIFNFMNQHSKKIPSVKQLNSTICLPKNTKTSKSVNSQPTQELSINTHACMCARTHTLSYSPTKVLLQVSLPYLGQQKGGHK